MNLLEVKSLNKVFGGLHAVQDMSFEVQQGTVHSLIGPNGAGKTTLINLITGMYTPTSGQVAFETKDITGLAPQKLPGRGMARTFQNLQVCMNMSAVENVMVGAHLRQNTGLLAGLLSLPGLRVADKACRTEALEAMAQVGIAAFADAHASQMPYGALKRLEIARALMTRPRMVLMDEPAAGLNPTETAEVGQLIRRLADQGLTVLLVEHDMPLVMRISNTITVLNYGKKLAEGTPEEMRSNPEVIAAYLGAEVEEPAHTQAEPKKAFA
ncbi:amino acid/amide ABC transporter ATP-binding protein 1, HAAT family (TC 3.A.1.4.-) [Polaromonas sp. YR568]|uniref:ABC transporter ATP-binding protein n=1 Tax=Polaromonas sp. YR568 TaxID=1855301 RepID=UPI0008E20C98|nr:ABC transporter ATP-binding protein [Polaromonas sp. YR568]SFU66213.1 amino acid/amide ABC transporter ATP-binding protein 1, HAAT family (TC 3.A.1.4.-) [Polaromonas sp. YR568]